MKFDCYFMKGHLSPIIMLELDELFQKMNWEIDELSDVKKSLYKRYCEILKLIKVEEQNLLIDLSYRFEQIGIADYIEFFLMSFHSIEESKLDAKEKIIFAPLIRPYIDNKKAKGKIEKPKTKSAQFLFYLLHGQDLRWIDYSSKFEFLETIRSVKESYIEDKSLLILIDDFVGSGKTAIDCIKSIKSEIEIDKKISFSDICVISIAAQNEGVVRLETELGVKVYCDRIRQKGITDFYPTNTVNKNMDLMLSIENTLKCPKEFSLGFENSEALITFMNKTPNNTFPVYWHETDKKIAPFPRYKIYK